ncbi:MAG: hypothetical protein HeimC3_47610 [Candidatus Heimdallarchaeota archaeon LC_3]|nr:MAG: hypothetical protein HeimC3_47610 [Candidatus Heimdallarchaeota archaeon LC_3]
MKSFYVEPTNKMEENMNKTLLTQDISSLDASVLNILKKQGPITRGQLVKKTGIPRSTLYDSLFRLMLKGLVKKFPDRTNVSRGRPQVFFEANT